jgi:dolichyl-phosphate beta-glucosyltransferase
LPEVSGTFRLLDPVKRTRERKLLTTPLLSIIIPAYNEEKRLPVTLEQVATFIQQQPYPAELLLIENGSRDRTLEIGQQFAARYPFIKAIHIEERGKGVAVKHGMLAAQGQYRFMCDCDLSMPISTK